MQTYTTTMANEIQNIPDSLLSDLRGIIDRARGNVAQTANSELTLMYWNIGRRINHELLGNKRAEYGKQVVAEVSAHLQAIYGSKGFEHRNIRRMIQFYQKFPDFQIVSTLSTQLTWSHVIEILPLKDDIQCEFYLTLCSKERWSVQRLRK